MEDVKQKVAQTGQLRKGLTNLKDAFNPQDPMLKKEILMMIHQYLEDEGYSTTATVIQDEANMKNRERKDQTRLLQKMRNRILDGDWGEVEKLEAELEKSCRKLGLIEGCRYFSYEIYKQQYLELIHRQEFHKAVILLKKKLKPLQSFSKNESEFQDLCYLLSCSQVEDASSFKTWVSISASREKLAERMQLFISSTRLSCEEEVIDKAPSGRLVHLLQQAVAYQIETSPFRPGMKIKTTSLMKDFTCHAVPSSNHLTFVGHKADVKATEFVGVNGKHLASGSSDGTVRIWDTDTGECKSTLVGHASKIWTLASDHAGGTLLSGDSKGGIHVWNVKEAKCHETHFYHDRAIYSVDLKDSGSHYTSAGYDAYVRLVDLNTAKVIGKLSGHKSLVSSVSFNRNGNIIISGSRDCTVRIWDSLSGACTRTIASNLGEVSCVSISESSVYILTSSKDNSLRLWDMRKPKCVRKYSGSQNTWKNFIRSCFGPGDEMIVSGSEDGHLLIWDRESGNVIQRIIAHEDITYDTKWNSASELLASCSHDGVVKTWRSVEKRI
mmetsp:Transcript_4673/g.6614  ORF Transcript_4673/g.6614 Transcript_4673/m.6614 type:complete len:553 (-) Transcript_4673:65-1723(-)